MSTGRTLRDFAGVGVKLSFNGSDLGIAIGDFTGLDKPALGFGELWAGAFVTVLLLGAITTSPPGQFVRA